MASEEVHGAGLMVYTTLDLDLQKVAEQAVLDGTAAYERRHGWKGHLQNAGLLHVNLDEYRHPDWTAPIVKGAYFHALVMDIAPGKVEVRVGSQVMTMTPADWAWTQNVGSGFLHVGDIVYVRVDSVNARGASHVVLEQDSGVQASMMTVDNASGEVLAMVGGRDFAVSQFNRATQAQRQVGSSFKPYVYSTAFENGAKPSDTILDAPTTFMTAGGPYTPHNYEGNFLGTITLETAMAESRNIPALKLADRYGISKVVEMAHRFGVTSNIPSFLPVAIGAADITLYDQVGAYTVFPNDGMRIEPHYIRKVTQEDGSPMPEEMPKVTEVISLETAREMMQLLQAVVQHGTGVAAAALKHPFGGKTGTTNDFTDAWFIGFSPSVTCGTWIGFDNRQSLGDKETGAKAALPMWIAFMKAAIANKPNEQFAAAGAKKRELNVPLPRSDEELLKPRQTAPPDESDPDAVDEKAPASEAPDNIPPGIAAPDNVMPKETPIPAAPVGPPDAAPRGATNGASTSGTE